MLQNENLLGKKKSYSIQKRTIPPRFEVLPHVTNKCKKTITPPLEHSGRCAAAAAAASFEDAGSAKDVARLRAGVSGAGGAIRGTMSSSCMRRSSCAASNLKVTPVREGRAEIRSKSRFLLL